MKSYEFESTTFIECIKEYFRKVKFTFHWDVLIKLVLVIFLYAYLINKG